MRSITVSWEASLSNRYPFSPCCITSGQNPVFVAMGKQFDNMASNTGTGPPSRVDAEIKMSMVLYNAGYLS